MGRAPLISVRRYQPADQDATAGIFLRAVRETASRDYTPSQIGAWGRVDPEAWARKRRSRPTWVAEIDGEAAGFADLEESGHLDMMFVDPRFLRRGVATALLDHVLAHARTLGLARVFTEASITARPFFTARGFSVIAEQTVETRGETLANTRMEKRLT